jgi:hypothetical protein
MLCGGGERQALIWPPSNSITILWLPPTLLTCLSLFFAAFRLHVTSRRFTASFRFSYLLSLEVPPSLELPHTPCAASRPFTASHSLRCLSPLHFLSPFWLPLMHLLSQCWMPLHLPCAVCHTYASSNSLSNLSFSSSSRCLLHLLCPFIPCVTSHPYFVFQHSLLYLSSLMSCLSPLLCAGFQFLHLHQYVPCV